MTSLHYLILYSLFALVSKNFTIPFFSTAIMFLRMLLSRILLIVENYLHVTIKRGIRNYREAQYEREGEKVDEAPQMNTFIFTVLLYLFPNLVSGYDLDVLGLLLMLFFHIVLSEPIYYLTHVLLHSKWLYKQMHKFHRASINTFATTGIVQDTLEHFIYMAIFSIPIILTALVHKQTFTNVILYALIFDIVNAVGHINLRGILPTWWNDSPLKYLFYSPEFHSLHHKLFKCNYSLFMPLWDYLFNTFKESQYMADFPLKGEEKKTDMIFIIHALDIVSCINQPYLNPLSVFEQFSDKVDNDWSTALKMKAGHLFTDVFRNVISDHIIMGNYEIEGKKCMTIALSYSLLDYLDKSKHDQINATLEKIIRNYNSQEGTKHFILGNLNKAYTVNKSGELLEPLIDELGVTISTGDCFTAFTVAEQIKSKIPKQSRIYLIGSRGKISRAVVELLKDEGYQFIFDTDVPIEEANKDESIKYWLIGKYINGIKPNPDVLIYDYSVPFIKMSDKHHSVGTVSVKSDNVLKGDYDHYTFTGYHKIYSCHLGGLLLGLESISDVGPNIDMKKIDKVREIFERLNKNHDFVYAE